ncbi:MAG: hypothetical protein IPK57_12365 [Chitinophagaceae bacterium]|nr:hypothetical protein [Chitinophagaceae bacterium]
MLPDHTGEFLNITKQYKAISLLDFPGNPHSKVSTSEQNLRSGKTSSFAKILIEVLVSPTITSSTP